MRLASLPRVLVGIGGLLTLAAPLAVAEEPAGAPRAFIDGTGPGWKALGEEDFVNVNCDPRPGPGRATWCTAPASRSA